MAAIVKYILFIEGFMSSDLNIDPYSPLLYSSSKINQISSFKENRKENKVICITLLALRALQQVAEVRTQIKAQDLRMERCS